MIGSVTEQSLSSGNRLPLLLEPELQQVRDALEAQEDEAAVAALRAVMHGNGRFSGVCPECNYLLGTIEERRGTTAAAVAAFELAAGAAWPLRDDAVIHLVRLALTGGQCESASKRLDSLGPSPLGQSVVVSELRARVELCSGNGARAVQRLRQLV
ncbi:MAG TPA: hypothetical protein VKP30_15345, partial [Polyangiaceae bacterium]|nr:hypothetical protein [Polyangiaceae bacterium]